jgi:MFS family permease
VGIGVAFPALMTLSMSGATPSDAGLASGLASTTVQVGGALGLAVLATLSASRTSTLSGQGHSQAAALTGGYHLAFWIAAALVAVSIVVALSLPATAAVVSGEEAELAEGREMEAISQIA